MISSSLESIADNLEHMPAVGRDSFL